jgi:hypothetical protein
MEKTGVFWQRYLGSRWVQEQPVETFPKWVIRKFVDTDPGSVCATFRPGRLAMGLVVCDPPQNFKCLIRLCDDAQNKKWTIQEIDPELGESLLVFEGARIAVSLDPNTMGSGQSGEAKLAGSAFLIDGEIAVSGLSNSGGARAYRAKDGAPMRLSSAMLPYFSSWTIEVPDGGAMWKSIFSTSRKA